MRYLLCLALLSLAGCPGKTEKPKTMVYVSCQAHENGFTCSIEHKQGDEAAQVCWDVHLSCANGKGSAVAHACDGISPMQTRTHLVAFADFVENGPCDRLSGLSVENVALSPPAQAKGEVPSWLKKKE